MPIVTVNIQDAIYPVRVEPGVLDAAGPAIADRFGAPKACVITDRAVAEHHLPALATSLRRAGIEPMIAILPGGEEHKTISDLLPVFDILLGARIERTTPVIALGGGIVGDMAGFVAAILLRGLPLVQVPTTLLAMVDSSVGGKTGVNHTVGKNLIGSFHQPSLVLADPCTLWTLPRRELIGGLAECIKHEVIRDADGFTALEHNLDSIRSLDEPALTQLIAHNVAIKARVVSADPFELGERAHLNFGHTFGHAIERVTRYSVSHGEAVALGMTAACFVAVETGMLDPSVANRITNLISRAGLPTANLAADPDAVVKAMSFDKKVADARIRLVLPDGLGHVVIRDDVPPEIILAAVQRITV